MTNQESRDYVLQQCRRGIARLCEESLLGKDDEAIAVPGRGYRDCFGSPASTLAKAAEEGR